MQVLKCGDQQQKLRKKNIWAINCHSKMAPIFFAKKPCNPNKFFEDVQSKWVFTFSIEKYGDFSCKNHDPKHNLSWIPVLVKYL